MLKCYAFRIVNYSQEETFRYTRIYDLATQKCKESPKEQIVIYIQKETYIYC